MTRPRALTSTFRSVIALLTALLIAVVGATALPAAALAGQGQAKGQQADRADNPGKAHQQSKAHQQGKAPTASNSQSAGKTQARGSSDKSQKPAKAQEAQPTRGQSGQAHESKTSHAPTSKPAGGSGDKGDPPGNNGTVKLAGFGGTNGPGHSSGTGSTHAHPSNDPHLPCGFSVEWFGFDAGVTSQVLFVQHAPTRGGSDHTDSVTLDNDSNVGGGSAVGFDGDKTYNLDFEGDPHPKHGYHVKLTTETPYSNGSTSKHKVFWVEPCEAETAPPGEDNTPPGGDNTPPGGDNTPPGEDNTPPGEDNTPPGDNNGVQDTVDENGGNTNTVVFGAQASVQNSQGARASGQSAEAGAEVPTAVEAGLTGDEAGLTGDAWTQSVLPLLALLFGFGTTFVALARRRTRVRAVARD